MSSTLRRGLSRSGWVLPAVLTAACAAGSMGSMGSMGGSEAPEAASGSESGSGPTPDYLVYVGAESADLMHRIRFGPAGAHVERTVEVGEMAVETEGPHGFALSPDGRHVYLTTAHGVPDGKLWKFDAGPDTLVAPPVLLGWFPATVDLTPDGLYAFVANFNLHGEHVPSTVSVVFTPDMIEVAQIETCVMPHGGRMDPSGLFFYSNCMMDDQLVEIDTRTFEVARRFSVAVGAEGPGASAGGHGPASCSPTWAQPSPDGTRVFVACNRADRILEIDRESWSLVRVLETGAGPYNLAVTPDGTRLVATLKRQAAIQVFDLIRGISLGTSPTSTTLSHGVVVSPDARYAFVTGEGVGAEPGRVDIFDLASLERVAGVDVGQQAGGITFWKMIPSSTSARVH